MQKTARRMVALRASSLGNLLSVAQRVELAAAVCRL